MKLEDETGILMFKNDLEWLYTRDSTVHVIQVSKKILLVLCIVLSLADERKQNNLIVWVQR